MTGATERRIVKVSPPTDIDPDACLVSLVVAIPLGSPIEEGEAVEIIGAWNYTGSPRSWEDATESTLLHWLNTPPDDGAPREWEYNAIWADIVDQVEWARHCEIAGGEGRLSSW